jgi:hypothetical protein
MRERTKDIYGEYLLGFTQEMFPVFVPLWKNKTVSLQVPHEAWLDQPPAAKSNRAKSADTKAAEIQRISAALVCYQVFAFHPFRDVFSANVHFKVPTGNHSVLGQILGQRLSLAHKE